MKTLLINTILIVSLTINHCSNQKNEQRISPLRNKIKSSASNDYLAIKKFFPADLVKHFPDTLPINAISFSSNFKVSQLDYRPPHAYEFYLSVKSNKTLIKKMLSEMNFIKNYSSDDPTPVLIFSYIEFKNEEYNILTIDGKNPNEAKAISASNLHKADELPIPLFSNIEDTTYNTFSGLDRSSEIKIIDAKQGVFIDTSHILKNKYLPPKWQNGYSRGIAISKKENIIIYWVVAW